MFTFQKTNSMKKLLLIMVLLSLTQVVLIAQTVEPSAENQKTEKTGKKKKGDKVKKEKEPKKPAAERAIEYSTKLKAALNLTDEQFTQILKVNTEVLMKRDALKDNPDKEAAKAQRKEIKEYRQIEFMKIFTDEQETAFKNMKVKGKNPKKKKDESLKVEDDDDDDNN
jgi:hypothetical protein